MHAGAFPSHIERCVALRSHANYKEYLITKNVHNYVTRPPFNYPLHRPAAPQNPDFRSNASCFTQPDQTAYYIIWPHK